MQRHGIVMLSGLVWVTAIYGCGGGEEGAPLPEGPTVELTGQTLEASLASALVREAPIPFARLGLHWVGAADAGLEVQVSEDGSEWSDWLPVRVHHVEHEGTSVFVGSVDVPLGLAEYYRLRNAAAGSAPRTLSVEFMEALAAEAGEESEDELSGVGQSTEPLTYGTTYINPRSAWKARAPRCRTSTKPYRFTIHHTADMAPDANVSPQAWLRSIQAYHMDNRGYCDIGYNFLVSRDGRLWEGRGATALGAHVANNNSGNVGVSFLGTYTSASATSKQVSQAGAMIRDIGKKFGIAVSAKTVKGHRDLAATACPGNALYRQLPQIIARAKAAPAFIESEPEPEDLLSFHRFDTNDARP